MSKKTILDDTLIPVPGLSHLVPGYTIDDKATVGLCFNLAHAVVLHGQKRVDVGQAVRSRRRCRRSERWRPSPSRCGKPSHGRDEKNVESPTITSAEHKMKKIIQ